MAVATSTDNTQSARVENIENLVLTPPVLDEKVLDREILQHSAFLGCRVTKFY